MNTPLFFSVGVDYRISLIDVAIGCKFYDEKTIAVATTHQKKVRPSECRHVNRFICICRKEGPEWFRQQNRSRKRGYRTRIVPFHKDLDVWELFSLAYVLHANWLTDKKRYQGITAKAYALGSEHSSGRVIAYEGMKVAETFVPTLIIIDGRPVGIQHENILTQRNHETEYLAALSCSGSITQRPFKWKVRRSKLVRKHGSPSFLTPL